MRMKKASSGPPAAPMLSSIRCTPKCRARYSGWADTEIKASRGAVRMPLPMRSAVTTAVRAQNPLANSRPIRATMESP